MTEREEVRFNVYSSSTALLGFNQLFPFDNVDFNIGGSFDTTTYQYTFTKAGTYLIGLSYNKSNNNGGGVAQHTLLRNGSEITITYTGAGSNIKRQTLNYSYIYKFEVGDVIYVKGFGGAPRPNNASPPTGDIYNSWWGIRLDY